MTATAAIAASATLAAAPEATTSKSSASTRETGETFNRVLDEQTAKALDEHETSHERRDTGSKPSKRSRATSETPLAVAVGALAAPSAETVRPNSDPLHSTLDDTGNSDAPKSGLATSTGELTNSWRTPEPMLDESSVDPHTPVAVMDPNSESDDVTAAAVDTASEASSTLAPLSERLTATTGDEVQASSEERSATASVTNAESVPTIGVAPSTTLDATIASTISSTSAALRTSLLAPPNSATARGGARTGSSEPAPPDSVASLSRRATSVTETTLKASDEPLVTPNVVRPTVSATPSATASSTAEASSLDVADLATSISQAALGPDGSYTLNVAMHPGELGHVQAVVSLNGDDLHVAITPQTPAGHAALANAVDSLKTELSRSGLNVNVSLRDPGSRSGRGNEEASRPPQTETDVLPAEGEVTAASESLTVSQIHLIL